jgi:hypothetical protein
VPTVRQFRSPADEFCSALCLQERSAMTNVPQRKGQAGVGCSGPLFSSGSAHAGLPR